MISIIIPAFNEEKAIGGTLKKIKEELTEHEYEIIVADDASADKTAEIAGCFADKVVVRPPDAPRSISANRNRGAAAARGDYLAFVDSDVTIPNPNQFFRTALREFEKNPKLVAVTCRIQVLPSLATWMDNVGFWIVDLIIRIANNVLRTGSGTGKFQMVRAAAFRNIGGYNEHLIAAEDIELFERLVKIGRTRFVPSLIVYHGGRRVHAIGWPRLVWIWIANLISVKFFKRAASKEWTAIR